MTSLIKSLEQQHIEELSAKYKQQGYKVFLKPQPDEVPPSLAKFVEEIDLIALKDDKLIVIEVKSRDALLEDDKIQALAQTVQENENWRFELVVINEPEKIIDDTEGLNPKMQGVNLDSGVEQTKALLQAGFDAPALVSAWAVIEAALREFAIREGVTFEERPSAQLYKKLTFLGLIEETDYDIIWNAMKLRNSIVHGFEAKGDFKKIAEQLLTIVNKISS